MELWQTLELCIANSYDLVQKVLKMEKKEVQCHIQCDGVLNFVYNKRAMLPMYDTKAHPYTKTSWWNKRDEQQCCLFPAFLLC